MQVTNQGLTSKQWLAIRRVGNAYKHRIAHYWASQGDCGLSGSRTSYEPLAVAYCDSISFLCSFRDVLKIHPSQHAVGR